MYDFASREQNMTFVYFAYGSNMLPARLSGRCPSARVHAVSFAKDYALEFSKLSTDGSGKATLVQCRGASVPGVLFEIDCREQSALDAHEGAGLGYDRVDDFWVEAAPTGERVCSTTYIATETEIRLQPFDWYLAVVIAGALHHGLDALHITQLRACGHQIDPHASRRTRLQAIEAMGKHGIADYHALLH
jgi:hypothetical protein